jgi:hypothetical protein
MGVRELSFVSIGLRTGVVEEVLLEHVFEVKSHRFAEHLCLLFG